MSEINTHGVIIEYGKHKGTLFTRLPVSYLRWMVNERAPQWEIAKAEFDRRGDTMPKVQLSGHAIDNASLRVRKIWHETKLSEDEGLYTWLQRVTLEAMEKGEKLESGKIRYLGMKFVIEQGDEFPSLVTIMKAGKVTKGEHCDYCGTELPANRTRFCSTEHKDKWHNENNPRGMYAHLNPNSPTFDPESDRHPHDVDQ